MKYEKFSGILNRTIFERSKAKLLERVALHPQRFVGLFRPMKAEAKIAQNLLQSHEIRMGDAMEEIAEGYLRENGFALLPKSILIGGEPKELDLHFERDGVVYFAEMKIRDDHDSTKKKGQMADFEAKARALAETRGAANLRALLFFVDPDLRKNQKFYREALREIRSAVGVSADIFYGGEFFRELAPDTDVWAEMESHLKRWKSEIPDFPEVNFDKDAVASAKELKFVEARIFRKIFRHEDVRREILPILFPDGAALKAVRNHIQDRAARKLVDEYLAEIGR